MSVIKDPDTGVLRDINETMYGQRDPLGTPTPVACEVDPDGPWLVMIDQPHHQIHEGERFVWNYEDSSMTTNDTLVMCITPSAGTYAHFEYAVTCPVEFTLALYEAPTLSASGTAIASLNRDRPSTKVSGCVVTHTPTVSGGANGTLLEKYYLGGGNQRAGGSLRSVSEWVLTPATIYMLVVTSRATGNACSAIIDVYVEGATT